MANPVDHLVYAVPDLAVGVAEFTDRTGVRPRPGGRHVGRGTANQLVGLGGGRYLEIIGPDPESDIPPSLFGLADLHAPRLVTWAIRTTDIDAAIHAARTAGYDPGAAAELSRQAATGRLQWRLTPAAGLLPFLIDWGDSVHPTASGLPAIDLADFAVLTPDPAPVRTVLAALDNDVAVELADQDGLRAVLSTPRGAITLAG